MNRMSARFVAKKIGMSTTSVYDPWKNMGLVIKDQFGDWVLTDLGRKNGGKMSDGDHLSVPVFDLDMIKKMMIDFNKNRPKQ